MLSYLFDWWIAHGNENCEPLNPRTREYARYLHFFPDSPRQSQIEEWMDETLRMFGGREGPRE